MITRYYKCIECGAKLVRHTSERVCPNCRPDRARRQRRESEIRTRKAAMAKAKAERMEDRERGPTVSPDGNPASPFNSDVERLKLSEQITLARAYWRDRVED